MPAPAPAAPKRAGASTRETIGFFTMVVGMFMAILDIQIVSSSISEIQAGLSASPDEISWVQTAYLIAEVVMIPLSGFLSRLLSTRILYAISAASFTLASLACAVAWNIESMILFRAVQGFLGGAMIPTVFAASFILFPPERRAGISVLIGLVATMAPTIGPTLGGYLTQAFSWHWLFLINVIPGVLVTTGVWFLVKFDKPNLELLKGFDFAGLALMALFLGSLEYVFEEGPRWDWFEDRSIFTFAVIGTLAGIGFFARVLSARNPIVDLRAFADRNFAVGCLFSLIIGVGLYGAVYIVPLFLARVRGLNSLQIGEIMFVTGLFQFASAPIAGMLSKKLDLRVMLGIGLVAFGTGVYLMTWITADWSFWELFWPQAIRGMSLMLLFLPINTLALGTLPPDKIKNASGLYNLMRNLGGAFGLAGINTVMIDRAAFHTSRIADHVTMTNPQVQAMVDNLSQKFTAAGVGNPDLAAVKTLDNMVLQQAQVLTFADCLLLMASLFYAGLLLMPLLRMPKQAKPPAEAH
ncbi:MAG TPA: DHA2 family efflux MFS transporter permease subunit [Inquilinus sp.]|nr:DHA2 family efflux MFS transporter permease subunit [Inquilinus sp.]